MSESDMEQKIGVENLARMERTAGSRSSRTTRATPRPTRTSASPRAARPCGCTTRSRQRDVKITIGQAQANHWGAGGGGKLILPGRRLRRDDRVEPLRVRHLAADALRRVRGPDALGHRRGRDDVRARLHDERRARHARPRDRRATSARTRGAPRGDHVASTRSTRTRARCPSTARPTSRSAASSRRPTTSSSTPAGAACRPTSC